MVKDIFKLPFRRRISSFGILAFYLLLNQALNFAFIYYYCRRFNISRRLVLINMAVSFGLLISIVVATGFFVRYCRRLRPLFRRWTVALIFAAWTSALAFLYTIDLFASLWWGNNVNYQLVYQYLIRDANFARNTLALSPKIYLLVLFSLIFIFAVHFIVSKYIVNGLEECFLPARRFSLFRDRKRSLAAAVALGLFFSSYIFFVGLLASNGVDPMWNTAQEPLTGFFRTNLYDLKRDELTRRLRREEPQIRARYPKNQTFERKNVVLIIVDSLRADHMQIYGYERPTTPFLSSLMKEGKLNKAGLATSTCAESICGILSTLSSRNFRSLIPQNFKIQDLLQDVGYKTYFILSGNHEYYGLKQAYGSNLTYYFDGASSAIYPHWDDDRIIFEGLEKVPDYDENPAFFQFHLMSSHFAGVRQDEYRVYQPSQVERDWNSLMKGEFDREAMINNYDNGVLQADSMIRKIFEELRRKNYLQRSIVVILSDHGESLGDRSEQKFGHVNSLYQEFIRIPLLVYDDPEIKYPALEYATQIDVAPTILARLGLKIPASWQGNSLLAPLPEETYSFHQTKTVNPSYAIIYRTPEVIYKYHYRIQNHAEELYELIGDPTERHNLMHTADRELIKQLRTKLEEYLSKS